MSQPLRAMDIKSLGGAPREAIKQGKSVFMCRVYGMVVDSKSTPNKRDPEKMDVVFIGDFRGTGPDGKEFDSERLYLPSMLRDKMLGSLKTAQGAPVEFGYDIYSEPAEKSITGYAFSSSSLIQNEVVEDRLALMAKKVANMPLPGSEVAPAPAAPAEPTPAPAAPAPAEPTPAPAAPAPVVSQPRRR